MDGGTRKGTHDGKSKREKARWRKRRRVHALEGERCKGCGAESKRRPSAEGCGFRFDARSAFLNLCPRMPLVMPIRDAFEPR